jgi:sugar phosphate isomerase/epimerase
MLKKKFDRSFRTGCTSYCIPGHIVPNVELMAPVVDDIEILCFEPLDRYGSVDENVVKRLVALKERHGISYTVHCPTEQKAGAEDDDERERFVKSFLNCYTMMLPLEPEGFVLHCDGIDGASPETVVAAWRRRVDRVCEAISRGVGGENADRICLENLAVYDPVLTEGIADTFGFSYCVDIGHLWAAGHAWDDFCGRHIDRTRIVHLHGIHEGKDHRSLKRHQGENLRAFVQKHLTQFRGVVTLEVFSGQDVMESLEVLAEACGG